MKDKTKLLYAEPINVLLFKKLLATENFEIYTAVNGEVGLEVLKENPDRYCI